MRAVVITRHGDPSVPQVQERPDPAPPGPGQVRIAVPLHQAPEAHRIIAAGQNAGKVVLVP
ncbi:MAG: hypothetical protein QOF26_1961 [Baekduia sp.]|nr:hypothetical protein [Baekduia sp.]